MFVDRVVSCVERAGVSAIKGIPGWPIGVIVGAMASSLPPAVLYIIGNEGCERFSFYGMRNILVSFLATYLLLELPEENRGPAAKEVFHTFVIGVYFFPLLGGWLADRFWGRYNTILWLSLIYTAGHACLALFEGQREGFYLGLFLIALGSGGIKPCVSAFVGDQFTSENRGQARVVFDAFYWIINFGSFFATLLIPLTLKQLGPSWAFGIPGVLMALATLVLWLGRDRYVRIPPAPPDPDGFGGVARTALFSGGSGSLLAGLGLVAAFLSLTTIPSLGVVVALCLALVWILGVGGAGLWLQLDKAREKHGEEAVEGVRSVLRLLLLFALITPFWSLFDQKASTWVLQADAMTKPSWFHAAQMQALNPALVMLLIPFNNIILYPWLRRLGVEVTALRKMTVGIALSGLAWLVVGTMQLSIDAGTALSITAQILPYLILTMAEVLVSATGLEFAYSQAPLRMKSALMSFWSLSVTVGNLWVLLVNLGVKRPEVGSVAASFGLGVTSFQMYFFAMFALVAATLFGLYARSFPVVDRYRSAG